jgi:hypothetical protein
MTGDSFETRKHSGSDVDFSLTTRANLSVVNGGGNSIGKYPLPNRFFISMGILSVIYEEREHKKNHLILLNPNEYKIWSMILFRTHGWSSIKESIYQREF